MRLLTISILFALCCVTPTIGQEIKGLSTYDTTLMQYHSPRKASFYSAVLPGLGQAYNKKYYKIPFLYAGAGALIYFIGFNNKQFVFWRTCYLKRLANDPNDPDYYWQKYGYKAFDVNQFKSRAEYWRRNRDYCILGIAGLYLASIIDATVDAYLFDYDVSQDLSLHIAPTLLNSAESFNFGLSCSFTF